MLQEAKLPSEITFGYFKTNEFSFGEGEPDSEEENDF